MQPQSDDALDERPPVPYFRTWVIYILAFTAISIPVRILTGWAAGSMESDALSCERISLGAQMLTGLLLLPVSFHRFRWAVRGMLVDGLRPGGESG